MPPPDKKEGQSSSNPAGNSPQIESAHIGGDVAGKQNKTAIAPRNPHERLYFATRDGNIEEFNAAIAEGARIKLAETYIPSDSTTKTLFEFAHDAFPEMDNFSEYTPEQMRITSNRGEILNRLGRVKDFYLIQGSFGVGRLVQDLSVNNTGDKVFVADALAAGANPLHRSGTSNSEDPLMPPFLAINPKIPDARDCLRLLTDAMLNENISEREKAVLKIQTAALDDAYAKGNITEANTLLSGFRKGWNLDPMKRVPTDTILNGSVETGDSAVSLLSDLLGIGLDPLARGSSKEVKEPQFDTPPFLCINPEQKNARQSLKILTDAMIKKEGLSEQQKMLLKLQSDAIDNELAKGDIKQAATLIFNFRSAWQHEPKTLVPTRVLLHRAIESDVPAEPVIAGMLKAGLDPLARGAGIVPADDNLPALLRGKINENDNDNARNSLRLMTDSVINRADLTPEQKTLIRIQSEMIDGELANNRPYNAIILKEAFEKAWKYTSEDLMPSGSTILHKAVASSVNIESMLPRLLDAGADPHHRNSTGEPVFLAVNPKKQNFELQVAKLYEFMNLEMNDAQREEVFKHLKIKEYKCSGVWSSDAKSFNESNLKKSINYIYGVEGYEHKAIEDFLNDVVESGGLSTNNPLNKYRITGKVDARGELKLIADAMLKTEGLDKKEKQLIQAQVKLVDIALKSGNESEIESTLSTLNTVWQRAKHLELAKTTPPSDEKKIPALVEAFLEPLTNNKHAPKFMATLKNYDLHKLQGFNDIAREVTTHIVLPQALLNFAQEIGEPITDQFLEDFSKRVSPAQLVEELTPYVRNVLINGRSLDKIICLNEAWHENGVVFPDHLKPLRAPGNWYSLTGQSEHAVPDSPDITIHVLTSDDHLKQETDLMNHCVGKGGYTTKCLAGETHIFSIRKAGQEEPLSTLEATWDGKKFSTIQHNGPDNRGITATSQNTENWLRQQLESGAIAASKHIGETEESKKERSRPEILRTIGFELTQENVDKAKAEYCENPRRRGIEFDEAGNVKPDPTNPNRALRSRRTELISGNYNDPESKKSFSFKELPADIWFVTSGMQFAVQPSMAKATAYLTDSDFSLDPNDIYGNAIRARASQYKEAKDVTDQREFFIKKTVSTDTHQIGLSKNPNKFNARTSGQSSATEPLISPETVQTTANAASAKGFEPLVVTLTAPNTTEFEPVVVTTMDAPTAPKLPPITQSPSLSITHRMAKFFSKDFFTGGQRVGFSVASNTMGAKGGLEMLIHPNEYLHDGVRYVAGTTLLSSSTIGLTADHAQAQAIRQLTQAEHIGNEVAAALAKSKLDSVQKLAGMAGTATSALMMPLEGYQAAAAISQGNYAEGGLHVAKTTTSGLFLGSVAAFRTAGMAGKGAEAAKLAGLTEKAAELAGMAGKYTKVAKFLGPIGVGVAIGTETIDIGVKSYHIASTIIDMEEIHRSLIESEKRAFVPGANAEYVEAMKKAQNKKAYEIVDPQAVEYKHLNLAGYGSLPPADIHARIEAEVKTLEHRKMELSKQFSDKRQIMSAGYTKERSESPSDREQVQTPEGRVNLKMANHGFGIGEAITPSSYIKYDNAITAVEAVDDRIRILHAAQEELIGDESGHVKGNPRLFSYGARYEGVRQARAAYAHAVQEMEPHIQEFEEALKKNGISITDYLKGVRERRGQYDQLQLGDSQSYANAKKQLDHFKQEHEKNPYDRLMYGLMLITHANQDVMLGKEIQSLQRYNEAPLEVKVTSVETQKDATEGRAEMHRMQNLFVTKQPSMIEPIPDRLLTVTAEVVADTNHYRLFTKELADAGLPVTLFREQETGEGKKTYTIGFAKSHLQEYMAEHQPIERENGGATIALPSGKGVTFTNIQQVYSTASTLPIDMRLTDDSAIALAQARNFATAQNIILHDKDASPQIPHITFSFVPTQDSNLTSPTKR